MEVVYSCIYIISVFLGICSIFLIQKSSKSLNGVCYFLISLVTFMCFQSIVGTVLSLCGLDVSGITVGIANYLLAGSCLIAGARDKKVQKYHVHICDFVVLGCLLIVAVGAGIHQFGNNLEIFNYRSTVDSMRHLEFARFVAVNHQIVTKRPFMAINSGLIFEVLEVYNEPYLDYRFIMVTDIFMLFLAGGMFWVLVRTYLNDRFLLIVGGIASIFYMIGFPLNNMVFGTSYLGAGVTVAVLIFVLIKRFELGEIHSKYFIPLLFLTLFGLWTAYNLFVPIVVVSVLVYFILENVRSRNILNKNALMVVFTFLCVACFLAICIIFRILPKESGVIQSLDKDGYMYSNLFGDYIFLIPFIIYRVYKCYRDRKLSFDLMICLFYIAYISAFLYANYINKMSVYYYYKNYYLFWAIAFYVLVIDIAECEQEKRDLIFAYCISVLALFLFIFSGLYAKLEAKSVENKFDPNFAGNLDADSQASRTFQIYSWNFEHGSSSNMRIDSKRQELYQTVAKLNKDINKAVPYVGPYTYDEFDFYVLAYQLEDTIHYYWDGSDFIEWADGVSDFICRIYDERVSLNEELEEYLSSLPIEYQNEAGCIYRVR